MRDWVLLSVLLLLLCWRNAECYSRLSVVIVTLVPDPRFSTSGALTTLNVYPPFGGWEQLSWGAPRRVASIDEDAVDANPGAVSRLLKAPGQ